MIKRVSLPYESSPYLTTPNSSEKIWRYLDFTKFVSVLADKALFFCRADKFDDKWEGAFPKQNVQKRAANWNISKLDEPSILPFLSASYSRLPAQTFINCWHLNDFESAAMWKLYLSSNEGIAIQTTYGRLINSFVGKADERVHIFAGKVRYLDYDEEVFPERTTLVPFLHKRMSFEHERELRAIIQSPFPGDSSTTGVDEFPSGLLASVNLDTLIERVCVAPTAPIWFTDLVKSAVATYGFSMSIQQSDIGQDPIY